MPTMQKPELVMVKEQITNRMVLQRSLEETQRVKVAYLNS
jgi:hypothetical protein